MDASHARVLHRMAGTVCISTPSFTTVDIAYVGLKTRSGILDLDGDVVKRRPRQIHCLVRETALGEAHVAVFQLQPHRLLIDPRALYIRVPERDKDVVTIMPVI